MHSVVMEQDLDVKAIRSRFGVTQTRLAEVVGVDQSTVSGWESGATSPRGPARKVLLSLTERDFRPARKAPKASKAKQPEAAQ